MNPILFSENSTTFTTNGIGRLSSAISCECVEERNGQYEVELTYPIDGQHYSDIGIRKIIVVIPSDGATLQAFRIYKISKPINGKVVINARHISYDLSKNTSMPFSITSSPSACSQALAGLKSHAVETCPFTFWTDVTTAGSYSQSAPASIKSRLGGVEGSILDQFGGEYEWDNFTVKLHRQRGSLAELNGLTLRYGKNITDITQEENIASTATGAVPYWQDYEGDLVTLPEQAVYSQYASRYSQHLTVPLDLSEKFDDKPTVEALRAAANVVVNASEFGLPKVSIEVSFVALWQTEEYKDIAPLQRVKLCDEVTVSFEKLGVDVTAKVVKTVYDVLAERYQSIQIGSVRSNLAMTLTDQNAQTLRQIEAQAVSVETAINNATKWLTTAGGYVIAIRNADGSWKELIFSNMTDPYDSNAKILRVNNNGIGFSLNGMNGTFRNAWTIDGNLVADFITTGTMSAARIKGGTLQLGGNNNTNGILQIVNASGTEIGKWDVNGINVKAGQLNINDAFKVDTAGKLTATGADIGGKVTISSGSMNINNAFKVDENGKLTATGADIGGKVAVTSGSMNINNNFIVSDQGAVTVKSGSMNINNAFKVDANGKLTATGADISGTITSSNANITGVVKATSGEIGGANSAKFTIENNHIKNGKSSLTDGSTGVYVGTDGIALGANSAFKVDSNGNLNASSATIGGSITSTGNNRSSSLSGGKLEIYTPSGGVYDQLLMKRGDEYIEMGAKRVFAYPLGESAEWNDIIMVAKAWHNGDLVTQ